jgi:lipoprotein NlpI
MPLADGRKYRAPSVSPRWLSELLYSPATGWRAGGLLLIGCVATCSLALNAVYAGALTGPALSIARYCLCPATLGWALLSRPRDAATRATSYVIVLKREWPLMAAASFAAVMLVVTNNAPRDALLTATFRESGFARVLKGDVDRGIKDFTTALGYKPDDEGALLLRSEALIEKHEYDQALADTDRLLAADPKDLGALAARGQIHRIRHDYAAAETDADRALIAKPEDAHLLSQRGEARQYLGKTSEASSDLERAARADPSAIEPHLLRVEFALNGMDLDAASREIDAASHLNPSAFVFLRGRVQFHRGDFAGAVSTLRAERNVNVLYPALWQFLAAARSGQDGAKELAARSATASRTLWPSPLVQVFLGEKTLDEARSTARDSDETCEVDYYGGEWRLARGERNAALAGLRRAAAQCPVNFVEYSAARIELRELGANKSGT